MRTPVPERGRDPWTAELELMAQLIEVVSITAAQMKLRKPIKVPRPKKDKTAAKAAAATRGAYVLDPAPAAVAAEHNPYRAAIRALGASQPNRLRAVGEGERSA